VIFYPPTSPTGRLDNRRLDDRRLIGFWNRIGTMRKNLFWLSNEQWAPIKPHLRTDVCRRRRGRTVVGDQWDRPCAQESGCRRSDGPLECLMRPSITASHAGRSAGSGRTCSANLLEAHDHPTHDRLDTPQGAADGRGAETACWPLARRAQHEDSCTNANRRLITFLSRGGSPGTQTTRQCTARGVSCAAGRARPDGELSRKMRGPLPSASLVRG
jgi:hypothetical protein